MGSVSSTELTRWFFTPIADDFTFITIPNSYNQLVKGEAYLLPQIYFSVQSYAGSTYQRLYYDQTTQEVFPRPLTVVIDADKVSFASKLF